MEAWRDPLLPVPGPELGKRQRSRRRRSDALRQENGDHLPVNREEGQVPGLLLNQLPMEVDAGAGVDGDLQPIQQVIHPRIYVAKLVAPAPTVGGPGDEPRVKTVWRVPGARSLA